jgi:hypothetical protein
MFMSSQVLATCSNLADHEENLNCLIACVSVYCLLFCLCQTLCFYPRNAFMPHAVTAQQVKTLWIISLLTWTYERKPCFWPYSSHSDPFVCTVLEMCQIAPPSNKKHVFRTQYCSINVSLLLLQAVDLLPPYNLITKLAVPSFVWCTFSYKPYS